MTDPAYLAYLSHGGELLRAGRVDESCAELERARAVDPEDVRAQGLLAVAYFRAGRLEEARELYAGLCDLDPTDASLRLNLGLILLKTGRHKEAITELEQARTLGAPPKRVSAYLGLGYARLARFAEARDAFRAAGQNDLAAEMDAQVPGQHVDADHGLAAEHVSEQLEAAPPVEIPPEPTVPTPVDGVTTMAVHPVTEQMIETVNTVAPAPPPPTPQAQLVVAPEPGDTFARKHGVLTVGAFGTEQLVRPDQGELPIEIVAGGALIVRVRGRMLSRTEGVVVSGGDLAYEPAARRAQGRATTAPFGSPNRPLFIVSGGGYLIAAPRGGVFSALRLRDDVVYIREDLVYAFEERLEWENGAIASAVNGADPTSIVVDPEAHGSGLAIVRLRGDGFLAMRSEREPLTIKVGGGKVSYVDASALAGWIGEVATRLVAPAAGGAASTAFVECSGEGVIIVVAPGAA